MINNPLTYILVRRNVINPEGIREIVNHIESSPAEDLSVFDSEKTNKTGQTSWRVDKETRDTQIVDAGPLFPKIEQLYHDMVREIVNPFFECQVDSSEVPQLSLLHISEPTRPY